MQGYRTTNGNAMLKHLLSALLLAAAVCAAPSLLHAFCVSGACFQDFRPSSSSYSSPRDNSSVYFPTYSGPSPEELERKRKQKEEEERQRAAENANESGIEFAKAGDWGQAIASFKKALEYAPGNAELTHNLNLAQELKGQEKEAGSLIANDRLDDLEAEARQLLSAQVPPVPVQHKNADTEADPAQRKAAAAKRKRLLAREAALDRAIRQDVIAIGRLGFDRRAKDFEEWVNLSDEAQNDLRREAKAQALDVLTSLAQDKMIESFRDMDRKRVERLIKWLKKNSEVPIDETINVLRQAAKDSKRVRMAGQAKAVVDGIYAGVEGAAAENREQKAKFYLTLLCDVGDGAAKMKWCGVLKSEALVTEAAVYNNAARRVAMGEVERLTQMTEKQLRGLKKLNEVVVRHVKERNEVRAKLKELR